MKTTSNISRKTGPQMEAVLIGRMEKARMKLEKLQQKQKLQMGGLAWKHNLHQLDIRELDSIFSLIARELRYDSSPVD